MKHLKRYICDSVESVQPPTLLRLAFLLLLVFEGNNDRMNENVINTASASIISINNISTTKREYSSKSGFKNATPAKGMANYKKDVTEKLKKLNLNDSGKEYKITVTITVLSTGIIKDVNILNSPNSLYDEQVKKIFREASNWLPAKRNGASIDSKVKITVKVK